MTSFEIQLLYHRRKFIHRELVFFKSIIFLSLVLRLNMYLLCTVLRLFDKEIDSQKISKSKQNGLQIEMSRAEKASSDDKIHDHLFQIIKEEKIRKRKIKTEIIHEQDLKRRKLLKRKKSRQKNKVNSPDENVANIEESEDRKKEEKRKKSKKVEVTTLAQDIANFEASKVLRSFHAERDKRLQEKSEEEKVSNSQIVALVKSTENLAPLITNRTLEKHQKNSLESILSQKDDRDAMKKLYKMVHANKISEFERKNKMEISHVPDHVIRIIGRYCSKECLSKLLLVSQQFHRVLKGKVKIYEK